MSIDQRRFRRYRGRREALAIVYQPTSRSSSNGLISIGQVVDVSYGGLALSHINSVEKSNFPLYLKIFGINHVSLRMEGISCKIIYDKALKSALYLPEIRRSGIQFDDLSPSQLSFLEYYMENYTEDEEKAEESWANGKCEGCGASYVPTDFDLKLCPFCMSLFIPQPEMKETLKPPVILPLKQEVPVIPGS